MRKVSKILVGTLAVSLIAGTTVLADTGKWDETVKMTAYTKTSTSYRKGNSLSYATLTCDQIVDNSITLNFYSSNSDYTSSVGTVQYPSKSGRANYSSYKSAASYWASVKLAPTSRYSTAGLNGNFTP